LFLLVINRPAWSQGEPIIVSVMGDVPYGSSEIPVLEQQMADHNLYSPSEYIFHVGDIKQQSEPCNETRYIVVADILKSVAVPAFIIPGDNEWTDCPDPAQAWSYWEAHLLGIEAYSCGTENVERQAVRPENFAFVEKGVLFMGINLVSSRTPSSSEWDQIMQADADWVVQKFQEYGSQIRAAVVTSQCGPGSSKHDLFFDEFEPAAGALGKPVLFIHGDGHSWIQDYPFAYSNIMRVQVEQGGNEDPVQLTVTMDTQNVNSTFELLRNPWNNNPPLFNVPPCVKAGDDQIVSVLNGINLQGSVKDDGVPLSPGTPTVTWSKVSGPGTVTFGNEHAAATTVSFNASGIYVLRLSAGDGQLVSEDELSITVNAGLAIYSFNPVSGPVGTQVTITGMNFNGTTQVAFNGVPASTFTVDSNTQVRATVPAGATTGKISMTKAGSSGFSNDDFVVVTPPVITSFSPAQGPVLTEVEISGSGLTTVTEVSFNGTLADSFFVDSDALIRAYVPEEASSGLISLTNPSGIAYSSSNFIVTHIPVIVGFTPTIGTTGTEVAIGGFNFTTATAVTFNNVPANGFIIDDDTSIRAVVPAGASSGKIKVTNPDGTVESSEIFTVTYPPAISGFTPAYGMVGEEVTITGSNFLYANQVAFNGISAASFIIDSDSQIRANVPSGATSGPITVGNPIDTVQSGDNFYVTLPSPSFTFNPSADARVRSTSPASNYGSDDELRVRNGGTIYNSYLKFNISGLTGAVEQATLRLYCTDGGSNGGDVYVVSNSWTESGITWNNAPPIGGTLIASAGTANVDTWVEIDVTAAISGNGIISLGMKSNSGSVYYSSKEGQHIPELIVQTTSTSIPSIGSFIPEMGSIGREITLNGSNFSSVFLVTFNEIASSSFTIDSNTELRAVVPPGATSGKISVINENGIGTSENDFLVVPAYTLATNVSGSGSIALDPPGAVYDSSSVVTLSATPDPGYAFTGWSGDLSGSANPGNVVMDANKTVTAVFTRQFNLATNVNGSGSVTLDPPGGVYDSLTTVTLTATPDPGYVFSGWSGDLTGAANPDSVVMDTVKSVTATFTRQFSLTTTVSGSGTVTLDPAGGVYDSLTTVTLTATPDPGYVFSGWSGDLTGAANPDSVIMDTIKSVTATFTRQFSLTTTVSGSGTVTLDPPGGVYDSLTAVELTATPDPGYVFSGWSGDLSGTANPDSVVMDTIKSVTATFTRQFSLTTTVSGSGTITLDPPGGVYDSLTTVELTATSDPGYVFSGWSGDLTGSANPNSVVMDTIKSVTATFIRQFSLTTTVEGSGTITLDPPGGVYDSLTIVTLTATPDPGYFFAGWSGDLTGLANPDNVVMDTVKSVTAIFEELPPPVVNVKAFLEGPYQNGSMVTIVKDNGGLPLAQPYNISPWNYSGGESVSSIPADVVDWVLVGLRSTETTAELSYRAAFIKSDGSIVDTSGSGGVKFEGIPYGDYFVVIYHRNHLAIMSSTARALSDASALYDFSAAMARAYGTNPMVELTSGVFCMIGGDGNSDGIVDDADKTLWRVENGTHWLYSKFGDFNLDGGIDALDLNYGLRVNIGSLTGVPGVSTAKASGKNVERKKKARINPPVPKSKNDSRKKLPRGQKTGDNSTTSNSHSEGTE